MDFDLQIRLQWLDTNHIQYGQHVTVVEPNAEGEAEVSISAANRLLLVQTTEKNAIRYLKQKKVADATICEFVTDNSVSLHLIECKRTVKPNNWEHAKAQFQGALLNAFAVCGLLNVREIRDVRLYTAYRYDRLSAEHSADPALMKMPVGGRHPAMALDWQIGTVNLLDHLFSHQKIRLDADGRAALSL